MSIEERFEILNLLGEGGMGKVYRALDRHLQKVVALKVISLKELNHSAIMRLNAESRILSRLSHPCLVQVFNFDIIDDAAYMSIEYVEGETLAALIQREGPLAPSLFYSIADSLLSAVSYIHKQGYVHRDIKPENIMVYSPSISLNTNTNSNTTSDLNSDIKSLGVKLLDLGLARGLTENTDLKLTAGGAVLGTPLYMSPEQISGETTTSAADIYSLGCLFYFMLCGKAPFIRDSALLTMLAHQNDALPLFEGCNVEFGLEELKSLSDIVTAMTAKAQSERFQSADSIRDDISRCQETMQSLGDSSQESKSFEQVRKPGYVHISSKLHPLMILLTFSILVSIVALFGISYLFPHISSTTISTESTKQNTSNILFADDNPLGPDLPESDSFIDRKTRGARMRGYDESSTEMLLSGRKDVDDDFIRRLPDKDSIRMLEICETKVKSLDWLVLFPKLIELNLYNLDLSEKTLESLLKSQNLRTIKLEGNKDVSKKFLAKLAVLPSVCEIFVSVRPEIPNAKMTQTDLAQLRERFPKVIFNFEDYGVSLLNLAKSALESEMADDAIGKFERARDTILDSRNPDRPDVLAKIYYGLYRACDLALNSKPHINGPARTLLEQKEKNSLLDAAKEIEKNIDDIQLSKEIFIALLSVAIKEGNNSDIGNWSAKLLESLPSTGRETVDDIPYFELIGASNVSSIRPDVYLKAQNRLIPLYKQFRGPLEISQLYVSKGIYYFNLGVSHYDESIINLRQAREIADRNKNSWHEQPDFWLAVVWQSRFCEGQIHETREEYQKAATSYDSAARVASDSFSGEQADQWIKDALKNKARVVERMRKQ